jgi:hypothetical protein
MAYKIKGEKRRKLKKEKNELQSYIDNFWYHHQLEKDMYLGFGYASKRLMTDKQAEQKFKEAQQELKEIENLLNEEE